MRSRETLPVRDPDDLALDPPDDHTVHGVVLAAGQSSRYGPENKLLEPLAGTPLVAHAVETAVDAAVDGVTVVVGYEADAVRAALDEFDVAFRTNEAYAAGQSTSLACGVAAARERGADAVVVLLGDMPHVATGTVDLLIAAYAGSAYDALAAAFEGKRGNPVLFDSAYFEALADVEGDVGGREILLERADAVAVETGDPGVLQDIDRPTDR
ncbi:MAG: nucleotidyltransferase family protein [Halovenus sp.]